MSKIGNLYVECYLDTYFIEKLLGHQPNGVHQNNAQVIKYMMDRPKAIGIIDRDKAKNLPSNINKFKLVDKDEANNLEFYVYENRFLVKVCRDIEHWLWHCNQQLDNPLKFPYENIETLKKNSKSSEIKKDPKITNFIGELIQRNPPAIKKLKLYLQGLIKNQY
jgi:hypothetical protein